GRRAAAASARTRAAAGGARRATANGAAIAGRRCRGELRSSWRRLVIPGGPGMTFTSYCVAQDAKRFSSSSPWSAQNFTLNCSAVFALAGAVGRLASVSPSSLASALLLVGPYAMFFAYSACAAGVLAKAMNFMAASLLGVPFGTVQ